MSIVKPITRVLPDPDAGSTLFSAGIITVPFCIPRAIILLSAEKAMEATLRIVYCDFRSKVTVLQRRTSPEEEAYEQSVRPSKETLSCVMVLTATTMFLIETPEAVSHTLMELVAEKNSPPLGDSARTAPTPEKLETSAFVLVLYTLATPVLVTVAMRVASSETYAGEYQG